MIQYSVYLRLLKKRMEATILDLKSFFSSFVSLQILVHLGLLSKQSGWKFAEMQFKGKVVYTVLIIVLSMERNIALSIFCEPRKQKSCHFLGHTAN